MVGILDQFGNEYKKRDVATEPQTARTGWLNNEFAGHPSRGLTPGKLARILETAERGDMREQADLYEDIEEKDGHVFAEMAKRRNALLTLDWQVQSPRNASTAEVKAADQINELLTDMDLADIIMDASDAIGKGYSCQETTWHRLGATWLPKSINHRPASWFRTTTNNQNMLRLRGTGTGGEQLIPINWIVHIHRSKTGYLPRLGLMRVLAWPYLFKNYSVRDLAEFLEIYGLPMRLGKYPSGATDKEKSTLLQAVVNIGHSAAGIVPDTMMMEFIEAAKGGSDPYKAMMDWCERTQSKVILGATLTSQTDSGSGAMALGNVHNEVRQDIRDADARQIEKTLTRQLVWPLMMLNTSINSSRYPAFTFDTQEPEDLKLYAESIPELVDVGAQIPVNWLHEKLRIPVPDNKETVLQRVAPGPVPVAVATATTALTANQSEPDELDRLANDMADDWKPVINEAVNPMLALARRVDNYQDFAVGLIALLDNEPKMMNDLLARGTFAARIYGMIKED